MPKHRDIAGQRFGRLVALSRAPRRDTRGSMVTYWLCRCDCGTEKLILLKSLQRGAVKSCGCLQREQTVIRSTVHGRSKTKLYSVWGRMIDRCTNPTNNEYHNYGGRGISVCDSWRSSFSAFAHDVGEPPSPLHSIDRWPDRNGNYQPGNVRWATAREQSRNRRGLVELDFRGRRVCLIEAMEMAGIPRGTFYGRLKRGWSLSDALNTPAWASVRRHGAMVQP